MKRFLKFTFILLTVAAVFSSCKKYDIDSLVGKWKMVHYALIDKSGKEVYTVGETGIGNFIWIFEADGTVKHFEDNETSNYGTYTLNNNILNLNGNEEYKITKLSSKDLTLEAYDVDDSELPNLKCLRLKFKKVD